jgi:DNA repair protein RadC
MTLELVTGHRERQKEKLLRSKIGTLHDYEILELLLFNSIPRKDVKPVAKKLIQEFGSIGKIINTPPSKLIQTQNIGNSTIILFRILQEVISDVTKEQILKKPIIKSWDKLIEYIRANIGYSNTEKLHTLYLNHKNILITDKLHDHGTVNTVSIYPREIVKSALFHDASSVIIVHNHPSGVTEPSKSDLTLTKAVQEALGTINVKLLDHLIVSSNSYFSFKTHDLI